MKAEAPGKHGPLAVTCCGPSLYSLESRKPICKPILGPGLLHWPGERSPACPECRQNTALLAQSCQHKVQSSRGIWSTPGVGLLVREWPMGRTGPDPWKSPPRLRAACLSGTASPRHQRGTKKISREALRAQPSGAGSKDSTSPAGGASVRAWKSGSSPEPHKATKATVLAQPLTLPAPWERADLPEPPPIPRCQ